MHGLLTHELGFRRGLVGPVLFFHREELGIPSLFFEIGTEELEFRNLVFAVDSEELVFRRLIFVVDPEVLGF